MLQEDVYTTIAVEHEVQYSIQRSRFLAYAYPVEDVTIAMAQIAALRKRYFDATHVCWAYAIGGKREKNRANDDGEPSGTAGKPIYGQILSADLSDVLVAVVRYFGGVKLGTSGLIEAYREGARLVLSEVEKRTIILEDHLLISFTPQLTGEVMYRMKQFEITITGQDFADGKSLLYASVRRAQTAPLLEAINTLYGAEGKEIEEG